VNREIRPHFCVAKALAVLIDNAFKFSTGGTVVRVESSFCNGELTLSIADRGQGMDAAQID